MQEYTLKDLQEKYEINLDKTTKEIKQSKAKTVLLQFPDGLKPYALNFVDYFKKNIKNVEFRIWLGSCFGACDIPKSECELLIQFGHTKWK